VAITHVQQIASGVSTSTSSGVVTVSGLSGINAGDLVCIFVQWGAGGGFDHIPATITYGALTGQTEIDRYDVVVQNSGGLCGRTTAAYGFAVGGETSIAIDGGFATPATDLGIRGGITIVVDVFRGFAGSVSVRDFAHQESAGGSGTLPTVNPSAGTETALWGPWAITPDYHPSSVTSGWTLGTEVTGGARQTANSAYRIISSPSGSYSATVSSAGGETRWIAYHVAFDGSTPPPPPPDPEPGVVLDPTATVPVPISDDIISWTITRGASAEITGAATAGSATVVLKNSIAAGADSDDKYNPDNASSALISYLRDGTALWIGVNSDGKLSGTTPRGLFGGRTQDWTVIPAEGASVAPTVEVTCEDALGWMGRVPVNFGYAAGRSQGDLRAAILAAADETRTDLAHEITTMPLSAAEGSALELLEALNRANGTRHFAKPADSSANWYTYTTRNRQWRLDATSDASLSQLTDHVTAMGGWRLSADTVINQQKATITPVVFSPAQTIVWQPRQCRSP
jgi:hypothetical protein